MPRLFTALELPKNIRWTLSTLRGGLADARWVEPKDFHLTLRFAGDIDDVQADDFAVALSEIRHEPVPIELGGLDAFGGARPRALIIKVKASDGLMSLQDDHEKAARRAGLTPEPRKFTPHITLARMRSGSQKSHAPAVADWISMQALIPAQHFTAERFVVWSARESKGGGPYAEVAAYRLG